MNLFTFFCSSLKAISLVYFAFSVLVSCNSKPGVSSRNHVQTDKREKAFSLKYPEMDQIVTYGDSVYFELIPRKSSLIDSVNIFIGGEKVYAHHTHELNFTGSDLFRKVGRQNVRMKIHYNDTLIQIINSRIVVLSDIVPKQLSYKVIRSLPHNPDDFIQGFFYYGGMLYEGTGRQYKSRIIKTDPSDGTTLAEHKLDDQYFGEGIARVEDRLYQLTYKHKVGFIYRLDNFEPVREFEIQTREGWGLTYDGEHLIMSDGSSNLYFYDPEYFTQVGQLDVTHDRGLVNNLNELEYVDGIVWANVYTTNQIVKIDACTGKVLGQLDLEKLYPKNVQRDYDHVLNGIAYNKDLDTYFITGKLWPVMYEIKIMD